jgi:hypothetical protein
MPVQKASGTENLRANPSVKSGTATQSPSGGGKDAGGTENRKADAKVFGPTERPQPSTYAKDSRPSGVQHFDSLSGDPR